MKGISIIGIALVIAIVVASTIIVLNIASPIIEKGKAYQQYNEAKQMLSYIDSVISELIFEAPGAMRTITLDKTIGELIVSGRDDTIRFRLDSDYSILDAGTRLREGNLLIVSGPTLRAYEADVAGNASTDLVLENSVVLFAMKKIGSPSAYGIINTTSIVEIITNKDLGINITPVTKLAMGGLDNSSYGYGYTQLVETGDDLAIGGIKLYMNSTSGIQYEALFTLTAGTDFIELVVRKVS